MQRLLRISKKTTDGLIENIGQNIERYRSGDFSDLALQSGWEVPLSVEVDLSPLSELDPARTGAAEVENSRLVWKALSKLRPSVACDEGIWTRLTHVECLGFTRKRWLDGAADDKLPGLIRVHFFADTLNRRRDDNPISRFWWNAFIAEQIRPGTNLEPLDVFLRKTDFRLNFIERSLTASRASLADGIVRAMEREEWLDNADNFESFMKVLNRDGGGMIFEALPEKMVDTLMVNCIDRAKAA